jgi:hypothetical protein
MQTVRFYVGGNGLWSTVEGSVEITDMQVTYVNDERDFGELCVYFNDSHWDVNIDGLIYTDKDFIADLKAFLTAHGLSTDVSYSEQGMQGDDYVSFDVGQEFLTAWDAKFAVVV